MQKTKRDYGSHEVYKRRNSWRCVIRLPKDVVTGLRPRKVFSGKTKTEATEKANEWDRLQELGLDFESGSQLLSQWLPKWLDNHCRTQNLRDSSKATYEAMVSTICKTLPTVAIKDLTPAHLDKIVLVDGEIRPSTVRRYRLLKSAITDAEVRGLIARTPFIRHKAPRAPRAAEARWLEVDEVEKLLEVVQGKRIESLVQFLLATGCRISEALALSLDDVDLDSAVPSVFIRRSVRTQESEPVFTDTKTKNGRRSIELSSATVEMIRRHIVALKAESLLRNKWEDNSLLFPSRVGTVWYARNVGKLFTRAVKEAGLDKGGNAPTVHSLRHSHASHAIKAGESIFVLSRRLGHSSSTLTMDVYSHLLTGGQAVAAGAFDRFMDNNLG
jgi:integrase